MIHPSAKIHASAVVEDGAQIGANCSIGAFCVLGPQVRLGDNVELLSHVVVAGDTVIGEGTKIWPFASVGSQPQDLKYNGEPSSLVIGKNNDIREYVTINPGTEGGGGVTRVGDGNLLMIQVHVGHDSQLGNNIVIANDVQIAGHVVIGDNAVIGSMAGLHQFCRVGKGAMVGAASIVVNDVIPYGTTLSVRASLAGLNLIGLRRRVDKAAINELRRVYKALFMGEGALLDRAQALADEASDNPLVLDLLEFVLANSDRSFCTPE
ncbi:MAG: acyl-ACP--UDP-N-acetylglucosamine O-acyltransferase [Alphaproteobacteria bacterium]|nr:acyl-ACP--UDP-N-acetylglucosamine O-acyltransferase [Alphaproteobacteria bacterium]